MKRSKRYRAALSLVDRMKSYSIDEAVNVIRNITGNDKAKTKFDQTINLSINLKIKSKHTVRDTITLPHPLKSENRRILVFATGPKADEAKAAGAAFVGDQDLIDKIKGGWVDFDVAISVPEMMKEVGKLGAVLGRRGLMPNPKTGTVSADIAGTIAAFKKGRTEFRADKAGNINIGIGKASFSPDQLRDNVEDLFSEVLKRKPSDLKGDYVGSVTLAPCMGPGVRVVHQSIGSKRGG